MVWPCFMGEHLKFVQTSITLFHQRVEKQEDRENQLERCKIFKMAKKKKTTSSKKIIESHYINKFKDNIMNMAEGIHISVCYDEERWNGEEGK